MGAGEDKRGGSKGNKISLGLLLKKYWLISEEENRSRRREGIRDKEKGNTRKG